MANKKYWGMRVHTQGKKNGIFVAQLANGQFAMYRVENDENQKVLIEFFSKGELYDEKGKDVSEKLKNRVKRKKNGVRVVDITISPTVCRTLMAME